MKKTDRIFKYALVLGTVLAWWLRNRHHIQRGVFATLAFSVNYVVFSEIFGNRKNALYWSASVVIAATALHRIRVGWSKMSSRFSKQMEKKK